MATKGEVETTLRATLQYLDWIMDSINQCRHGKLDPVSALLQIQLVMVEYERLADDLKLGR